MEIAAVQAALQEIAHPYADKRVNVFEVDLIAFGEGLVQLGGRVLEPAQRQAVEEGLAARFPGLRVDTQDVQVLRETALRKMCVATNLTSVHSGCSFLAEQVTQMLNGAAVEVLWEDDQWGYVRQEDGYLGWTYLPYLTEKPGQPPSHLVTAAVSSLRSSAEEGSAALTRVLGGTPVTLVEEKNGWGCVEMSGDFTGWLPSADLRALDRLPRSVEERRAQISADAFRLTGVPYLWGGCSANGIDCSGFAQLLHRWIGITIPRDADMQYDAGTPVEAPFETGDLLFFGELGARRRITHVTVSLGGWKVIHSSRSRNGVYVDDVQEVPHLRDSFLFAASYIRR